MLRRELWIERHPGVRELIRGSGITSEKIHAMKEKIVAEYKRLGEPLSENNAWKKGKLDHVLKADERATLEVAPLLGFLGVEVDVLGLLLLSHDIGRLTEAKLKEDGIVDYPPHGILSVYILRLLFPELHGDSFWEVFLIAIERHSDQSTPRVEELGDVAWAFATIVRDLDKGEGFEKVPKYVGDQAEKQRQIATNWSHERRTDPTCGDEKGAIVPEYQIGQFEAGQTITRKECQSYEAFMLQLLAWLHDVVNPEIRNLIIKGGGPALLMEYFEQQLAEKSSDQLLRIRRGFLQLV